MAMHSSLKSCLMEMREPVVRSLKTWADCALGEIVLDIFKVAHKYGFMKFLLATWNLGPDVVRMMLEQCSRVSGGR